MFHSLFGRIYGFTFFFRDLLTFRMLLQILFYTIVFYLKNNMNISLHSDKDLSMLRFTTSIGFNKNGGRSKYFRGPVVASIPSNRNSFGSHKFGETVGGNEPIIGPSSAGPRPPITTTGPWRKNQVALCDCNDELKYLFKVYK